MLYFIKLFIIFESRLEKIQVKNTYHLALALMYTLFLGAGTGIVFGQSNADCFSHILNGPSFKAGDGVSIRYGARSGCQHDGQITTDVKRWEPISTDEETSWVVVDSRLLRVSISTGSITDGFMFQIPHTSNIWRPGYYKVVSKIVQIGGYGSSQNIDMVETSFFQITGQVQYTGLVQPTPVGFGELIDHHVHSSIGCDGTFSFPVSFGGTATKAVVYQDQLVSQVVYQTTLTSNPSNDSFTPPKASVRLSNQFRKDASVMVHTQGWDYEIYNPNYNSGLATCYPERFSQ